MKCSWFCYKIYSVQDFGLDCMRCVRTERIKENKKKRKKIANNLFIDTHSQTGEEENSNVA